MTIKTEVISANPGWIYMAPVFDTGGNVVDIYNVAIIGWIVQIDVDYMFFATQETVSPVTAGVINDHVGEAILMDPDKEIMTLRDTPSETVILGSSSIRGSRARAMEHYAASMRDPAIRASELRF